MESKFHQRLKSLQNNLSNAEFARKIGVKPSTFQRYDEGSLPRIDAAAAIAEACGVSLDWLVGEDTARHVAEAAGEDVVSLPRYDIQASAGHGALAGNREIADFMTVSRDWLARYVPNGARVVVIEARGDSMEPTVDDGDLLFVEMGIDTDSIAAGGVFVINVGDLVMIKRLQILLNGDLRVSSDNQAYAPETIPAAELEEKVMIHGRVFWVGGPLGGQR